MRRIFRNFFLVRVGKPRRQLRRDQQQQNCNQTSTVHVRKVGNRHLSRLKSQLAERHSFEGMCKPHFSFSARFGPHLTW